MENFKYLVVNINSKNDLRQEINEIIERGNRCYHSINTFFKFKLMSTKVKNFTLYKL